MYYWSKTPNSTIRLWVSKEGSTTEISSLFGMLSIWGGWDKTGNCYVSWELDLRFEACIDLICDKVGLQANLEYFMKGGN